MSMHLVGPGLTTTNYKKRKQKGLTKRDRQAQIEHDKWLKKMGVHSSQVKENPKPLAKRETYERKPDLPELSNSIDGYAPKKESQQYTGTYITGIATMHKSNMIPISSKKDAVEVARMRRG